MPNSKSRHHHHKHAAHTPKSSTVVTDNSKSNTAAPVLPAVLFLALLGAAAGYFLGSGSSVALIAGLVAGAGGGYIIGLQITKSLKHK